MKTYETKYMKFFKNDTSFFVKKIYYNQTHGQVIRNFLTINCSPLIVYTRRVAYITYIHSVQTNERR